MVLDICLNCGFIHQSVGDLRYVCTKCDRLTYHVIIPRCSDKEDIIPRCSDKEDMNLENFYCGGLK